MQPRRENRKRDPETGVRRLSLDSTDREILDLTDQRDALDRKMSEAIERIERVRSMALLAVGRMMAERN